MSKASFLIEMELPPDAQWLKPPDQVAATAQKLMSEFMGRFVVSGICEIKITVRPFDWRVPVPELEGTHSCILYFETEADLDEFEKMFHQAKPGMRVQKL